MIIVYISYNCRGDPKRTPPNAAAGGSRRFQFNALASYIDLRTYRAGVGGNSVRQDNVSGGHIFPGNSILPDVHPRTNCPRMFFNSVANSIIKWTDDGLYNSYVQINIILAQIVIPIVKQQRHSFPYLVVMSNNNNRGFAGRPLTLKWLPIIPYSAKFS